MVKRLILIAIKLFQSTRVLRAPACRFYPSCSDYACACIERHGAIVGLALTAWRLLKCQPLHPGGVDLAPDRLAMPRTIFCTPIFSHREPQ